MWQEPDLDSEHTGGLKGPEAVLTMTSRARELTGATFLLHPRHIVANGEHAVALVDWSAIQGTQRLAGGRPSRASFQGGDPQADA